MLWNILYFIAATALSMVGIEYKASEGCPETRTIPVVYQVNTSSTQPAAWLATEKCDTTSVNLTGRIHQI